MVSWSHKVKQTAAAAGDKGAGGESPSTLTIMPGCDIADIIALNADADWIDGEAKPPDKLDAIIYPHHGQE